MQKEANEKWPDVKKCINVKKIFCDLENNTYLCNPLKFLIEIVG